MLHSTFSLCVTPLGLTALGLMLLGTGCLIKENELFEVYCEKFPDAPKCQDSGSGDGSSATPTDGTGDLPTTSGSTTDTPTSTEPTSGSMGGSIGETDTTTEPTTGEDPTGGPQVCEDNLECQIGFELCSDGVCEACPVDPDGITCSTLVELYDLTPPSRGCGQDDPLTVGAFADLVVESAIAARYQACPGENSFDQVNFLLSGSPELRALWSSLSPDTMMDACDADLVVKYLKNLNGAFGHLATAQPGNKMLGGLMQQFVIKAEVCGVDNDHPLLGLRVLFADGVNDCTTSLQAGEPQVKVIDAAHVNAKAPGFAVVNGEADILFTDGLQVTAPEILVIQVDTSAELTGFFCAQPASESGEFLWVQDWLIQQNLPLQQFEVIAP